MRVWQNILIMGLWLVFIIGANEALYAQCKSTETIEGIGDYSNTYDACDSYVKNTLVGQVVSTGGYTPIRPTLWADGVDYGREFDAYDFAYGYNTIEWWLDGPVWTKENHYIVIDFQPDIPKENKYWSAANTSYTVRYYATQGQ